MLPHGGKRGGVGLPARCAEPRAASDDGDITALLQYWHDDPAAADRLLRAVYPRLKRIAGHQLAREGPDSSLQVSDLAHEALLRLLAQRRARFHNRRHFFTVAARLVRRALVDRARRRLAEKRREGLDRVTLEPQLPLAVRQRHPDLLALELALGELERIDAAAVRVIELRYFLGLSIEEAAAALGMGRASVVRSWRRARVWLEARLERPAA